MNKAVKSDSIILFERQQVLFYSSTNRAFDGYPDLTYKALGLENSLSYINKNHICKSTNLLTFKIEKNCKFPNTLGSINGFQIPAAEGDKNIF